MTSYFETIFVLISVFLYDPCFRFAIYSCSERSDIGWSSKENICLPISLPGEIRTARSESFGIVYKQKQL